MDGKIHEVRRTLKRISHYLERYPNLKYHESSTYSTALELIEKYSFTNRNPNHISEKEVKCDLRKANEILEKIQKSENYGHK